jgi:zinc/manganese transport system ATP-binding protein
VSATRLDGVEDHRTSDSGTPLISVRDAAVRFGNRVVWSGLTFDIHAGEFVAVLGPNGVGKSTLLKSMLGLVPLSHGEILIGGVPPRHGNPDVGYLPQRRSFDSSVRIRGVDVVRLGLDGDRWGVPLPAWVSPRAQAASRRVGELLELVEASAFAPRPIGSLSGGEQQRLLIAQALARQPALLLLDEPLDSLDLPSEAAIAALLGRICRHSGVTVVIVAHDVNPILSHLDRVVYLARGRAVAGRPDDVITSETLTALYGARIEVLHTEEGSPVVVGQPDAASYHPGLHGERERHLHG